MSYSDKLSKKLQSSNFKIPKRELQSPGVIKLNSQYDIIPITKQFLDSYPLVHDFLISCYTQDEDFANLFGVKNNYLNLLNKEARDKVIIDFYYDKASKNHQLEGIDILNYLIVNNSRHPVGVVGTCDYNEFPKQYIDDDGKEHDVPSDSVFLSVVIQKKFRQKGIYSLSMMYLTNLVLDKGLHCCQYITHDNEISQKAAQKINFVYLGANTPEEEFKKKACLYEYLKSS